MYFKKIHFIFSKKFGVRNGFDCNDVEDMKEEIKRKKKRAAENGYVYATVDEIYDMISKHCLKK